MTDRIVNLVLRYLPTFLVVAATVYVLVGEKILLQETLVIALVATIGIDLVKMLLVEGMTPCSKCTDPRGCLDTQGNIIAKEGECIPIMGSTDPRPPALMAMINKRDNEWNPAVTRMKNLLKSPTASKTEIEAEGAKIYSILGDIGSTYKSIGNNKYCHMLPDRQTTVCDIEERITGDYSRIPYDDNKPHDPKSREECKSYYSDKRCFKPVQDPATWQSAFPDIQ